jgi:uncharacterized membrane protein
LADEDTNPGAPGVADHLKAALVHAMEAVRCYAAILTADAERRARGIVDSALWSLAWLALGIVGVVFVSAGLANLFNEYVAAHSPGLVHLITGIIVLATFVAIHFVRKARKGSKE